MDDTHILEAVADLLRSNGWDIDTNEWDDIIFVQVDDWKFDLKIQNVEVIG